jgi:3-phosphoshikimate 1-carboxyvinyltransferase
MNAAPLAIQPLERPPSAIVTVPGSKSITNRALLIAALAEGRSELHGALFSDDTHYMVAALRALGVRVDADEAAARIAVEGCGGRWPVRFLVAALCLGHGRYRIDGTARMRERPIRELVDALRQLGVRLTCAPNGGPPVVVEANGLPGGVAELNAERSSQFLSALLLVAPYADHTLTVRLQGTVIAQPYIDLTRAVMLQWGIAVEQLDAYREFRVAGGQRYRAQTPYAVEPDASSAHYFWAAAALTGGRVGVEGLTLDALQGDVRFVSVLGDMGVGFHVEANALTVVGGALGGIDVDLNGISDTVPTLAAIAPFASAPVRIRNVAHLRWQESDRLRAVAAELARLGARVQELDDGLQVEPARLHGGDVHTYDDHRIAMAFALIGLRVPDVRIEDPGCVAKTFPDYFERLEQLRR